jgi:HD-GYP domain-containing protein (c-di-GMP phosphodiesterase class II)
MADAGALFGHEDRLSGLGDNLPLNRKLRILHESLKDRFPFIDRAAVAVHDPLRGTLRTYLASDDGAGSLRRYESRLDDAPSLKEILAVGRPRVVNDLKLFEEGAHEHTRAIRSGGYLASYTMPVRVNGSFWGFVFFNSRQSDCFTPEVLDALDVYAHLAASVTFAESMAVRALVGAVKTAHAAVHLRDPETGKHLERMAEYSRLIARELSATGKHDLDDERIERLHLFAPLHDLGKIGIPDRVLLKEGPLSDAERAEMKVHPLKGAEMIDRIASHFGLEQVLGLDVLRAVARDHHEAMDGSGYPRGLKGDQIPIEARIVAVADVFDALSSRRPYKAAWSNEESFAILQRLAREKLDGDCVEALMKQRTAVEEVQARFREPEPAG